MNTAIYYFSGTGNSLSVAKKLNDKIENSSLKSIPQVDDDATIIHDIIGIVTPIYMHDMPHIVLDFIKKIQKAQYIFLVYTGSGELGSGVKTSYKYFKKNQLNLNALFNITMPSNYTPYGATPIDKQNEQLGEVDTRVDQIIATVIKKEEHRDSSNTSLFATYVFPALLYKIGHPNIKWMAKKFTVDDTCNGCDICQKVCPVDNIKLHDKKPQWNDHCQQCYACLQWCPKKAIQYGNKTANIERYHHPDIKLKEIIASKK